MQTAKELRVKAAELATEARKKYDEITDSTTADQAKEIEARFDTIMADHDELIERAERAEKLEAAEKRALSGMHGNPGLGDAGKDQDADAPNYREAFFEFIKCGGDASAMDAEARAVLLTGDQSSEFRAQTTATGAAGGFTVPTELRNVLVESMAMHGPMYDGTFTTEIVTSGGGQIDIPAINDTANSASAHTEGGNLTDDGSEDAVFAQRTLNAYTFATAFIRWSMELGQDSIFNMEQLLGKLLGQRTGRVANEQLTVGTGTDAPHGVAVAAGAGVTAAGAAAITGDELIDLFHSVDPAYRAAGNLSYMMNDTTLAAVRKLKDGQGNYLWQMGDVQKGIPQTLNGAQVKVNQDMPAMTTGNRSVLFGDFSAYYVRKVGAPVVGVMRERFFPNLGIASVIRFDGELSDTGAIKALTQA